MFGVLWLFIAFDLVVEMTLYLVMYDLWRGYLDIIIYVGDVLLIVDVSVFYSASMFEKMYLLCMFNDSLAK